MTTGLQFMEGGDKISPTECVKKYEDTGHETIIRELTQNALDAARKAGCDCTLRFEIRKLKTDDLPGITEYRQHLSDKYMQEWLNKGQRKFVAVLKQLKRLAAQPETECLLVFDNGIGLDHLSMEGLIGKGDSDKREDDGASGGTHGVGHETAFAAGDMNYVMYGGVNGHSARRRRVASGHVIFPTHLYKEKSKEKGIRWGGHGYLSQDVAQVTLSGVGIIDNEFQIPPLIQKLLGEIEGAGSVVIIPAFNRFPGDSDEDGSNIVDLICQDIAKHFFVAVDQDRLNVFVRDYAANEKGTMLKDQLDDASDVKRALDRVKGNTRARGNRLIAGSRSYDAWTTYLDGERHTLLTRFGAVQVRVRYPDTGRSRIAILRAGMFITDDDANLPTQLARHRFSSRKLFHAVLLFAEDIHNPTDADNILRKVEDHGHSSIRDVTRGTSSQETRQLFSELQQELLRVLERQETASAHTPDVLPVVVHRTSGVAPLRRRTVRKRAKTHRTGDDDSTDSGTRGGKGKGNNSQSGRGKKRSVSHRLEIPTSVVPDGAGRIEVEIAPPAETVRNAFLQLETLTGSDATCEAPLRSRYIELDLANSVGVPPSKGTGSEIRLGTLTPDSRIRLTLQLANGQDVGLPMRAEIFTKTRERK